MKNKYITFKIDEDILKTFRLYCLKKDTNMTEVVRAYIQKLTGAKNV